jgi:hypothetical protein
MGMFYTTAEFCKVIDVPLKPKNSSCGFIAWGKLLFLHEIDIPAPIPKGIFGCLVQQFNIVGLVGIVDLNFVPFNIIFPPDMYVFCKEKCIDPSVVRSFDNFRDRFSYLISFPACSNLASCRITRFLKQRLYRIPGFVMKFFSYCKTNRRGRTWE